MKKIQEALEKETQRFNDFDRAMNETVSRLEEKGMHYHDRFFLEKTLNDIIIRRSESKARLEQIEKLKDEVSKMQDVVQKRKHAIFMKIVFAVICISAIAYLLSFN